MDNPDTTAGDRIDRRQPPSRRAVLALGGAVLATGFAGCSEMNRNSTQTVSEGSTAFDGISFEGLQMVVSLGEDNTVERVNLIKPDGSKFSSKPVVEGARKVKFQILEIDPGRGGFSHYSPGKYRLTFVRNNGQSTSKSVELQPQITVTKVSEWNVRDQTSAKNAAVTVLNRGSAPTWIYNIAYRGAPNDSANELGDNPGIPESYLKSPEGALDTIVRPGQRKSFVGSPAPFWFQEPDICKGGSHQFETIVQIATGTNLERPVTGSFSGGVAAKQEAANQERYACKDAEFELTGGDD